jgi:hypothetical protein
MSDAAAITAPAGGAVQRGDDRLLEHAHVFDQTARQSRERVDLCLARFEQLRDDVLHVASGAERSTCAREHDRAHAVARLQCRERVGEFRVGLEGERVQALGTIEAHHGDAAFLGIAKGSSLHVRVPR